MKSKEKVLTILIGTILLLAILIPIKSNAALQANGSASTQKTISQWMSEIREMESLGGTLGLDGHSLLYQETENDDNLPVSNNLDIHMQKNTEYGAMAILSSSSYGKSTPVHETSDGSLSTTTGNKSGVYMNIYNYNQKEKVAEWVCAGSFDYDNFFPLFKKASQKYKDYYKGGSDVPYVYRIGDAITETKGWHGSTKSNWMTYGHTSGLLRAYSGSIFSYEGSSRGYTNGGDADLRRLWASRAVVVVGNGF